MKNTRVPGEQIRPLSHLSTYIYKETKLYQVVIKSRLYYLFSIYKEVFGIIPLPLFRPVQWYWGTMSQDGNIAAHLTLLCAADIWGGVLNILFNPFYFKTFSVIFNLPILFNSFYMCFGSIPFVFGKSILWI